MQRFAPEFEKRWNCFARRAGRSWRVEETYVKLRGRWVYLSIATAQTVDFRLSEQHDVRAANAFFRKTLKTRGCSPVTITLDRCAASHRAVCELSAEDAWWKDTKLRSSK